MLTPIFKLLWEFWRQVWWRLPLAFFGMLFLPVIVVLAELRIPVLQFDWDYLQPLRWEAQMVIVGFNTLVASLSLGYSVGFATRHYALPITMGQLTFVRLIPGAVACSGLMLAVNAVVNAFGRAGLPYYGPALTGGMVYLLGYALVSRVYGRDNLRAIAGVALAMLSLVWVAGHYDTVLNFGSNFRWPEVSVAELSVVLAVGLMAWFITLDGFQRDRQSRGWTQPVRLEDGRSPERVTAILERRFTSPFAALFWQDWKQDGWLWPVAVTSTYAMIATLQTLFKLFRPSSGVIVNSSDIINISLAFLGLTAVLPWCLGVVTVIGRRSQSNDSYPKATATLPVSDALLAWVMVLRSILSVSVSAIGVVAVGLVWMLVSHLATPREFWQSNVDSVMNLSWLEWLMGFLWWCLMTWITIAVGAATGLSGRRWIAFLPITVLPCWLFLAILVSALSPVGSEIFWNMLVQMLAFALIGGVFCAYLTGYVNETIGVKSVVGGLLIFLVLLVSFSPWLHHLHTSMNLGFKELWSIWSWLGLLMIAVVAPPAVIPVSVHYNRHR